MRRRRITRPSSAARAGLAGGGRPLDAGAQLLEQSRQLAAVGLGQRRDGAVHVVGRGGVHLLLLGAAGLGELHAGEPGVRGVGTTPHEPGLLHGVQHLGHRRARHVQRVGEVALRDAVVGAEQPQAHRLAGMQAVVPQLLHHQTAVLAHRRHEGAEDLRRELVDAVERLWQYRHGVTVHRSPVARHRRLQPEKVSTQTISLQTTLSAPRARFHPVRRGTYRREGSCRSPRNPRGTDRSDGCCSDDRPGRSPQSGGAARRGGWRCATR